MSKPNPNMVSLMEGIIKLGHSPDELRAALDALAKPKAKAKAKAPAKKAPAKAAKKAPAKAKAPARKKAAAKKAPAVPESLAGLDDDALVMFASAMNEEADTDRFDELFEKGGASAIHKQLLKLVDGDVDELSECVEEFLSDEDEEEDLEDEDEDEDEDFDDEDEDDLEEDEEDFEDDEERTISRTTKRTTSTTSMISTTDR